MRFSAVIVHFGWNPLMRQEIDLVEEAELRPRSGTGPGRGEERLGRRDHPRDGPCDCGAVEIYDGTRPGPASCSGDPGK